MAPKAAAPAGGPLPAVDDEASVIIIIILITMIIIILLLTIYTCVISMKRDREQSQYTVYHGTASGRWQHPRFGLFLDVNVRVPRRPTP